jgi:hypothetical protein
LRTFADASPIAYLIAGKLKFNLVALWPPTPRVKPAEVKPVPFRQSPVLC